jgi:hypothetical protein
MLEDGAQEPTSSHRCRSPLNDEFHDNRENNREFSSSVVI